MHHKYYDWLFIILSFICLIPCLVIIGIDIIQLLVKILPLLYPLFKVYFHCSFVWISHLLSKLLILFCHSYIWLINNLLFSCPNILDLISFILKPLLLLFEFLIWLIILVVILLKVILDPLRIVEIAIWEWTFTISWTWIDDRIGFVKGIVLASAHGSVWAFIISPASIIFIFVILI